MCCILLKFNSFLDDFKPASVDTNKKAAVNVAGNNQVTVTVPHLGKLYAHKLIFYTYVEFYMKSFIELFCQIYANPLDLNRFYRTSLGWVSQSCQNNTYNHVVKFVLLNC